MVIRAVHADGFPDPATGETMREAVIVIDGGHVTHAGARATTQVPRDAEVAMRAATTVAAQTIGMKGGDVVKSTK